MENECRTLSAGKMESSDHCNDTKPVENWQFSFILDPRSEVCLKKVRKKQLQTACVGGHKWLLPRETNTLLQVKYLWLYVQ